VLCGALWVGGSACVVLAVAASDSGRSDSRSFPLLASLSKIDRLQIATAAGILATGLLNLYFIVRGGSRSVGTAFAAILTGKLILFAAMVSLLWISWHRLAGGKDGFGPDWSAAKEAKGQVYLHGFAALCGAIALALGIWLAGS
jgi:putative copper export protein